MDETGTITRTPIHGSELPWRGACEWQAFDWQASARLWAELAKK